MKRSNIVFLVALITLFGATLRFYRLNAVPLRGDEAFTVLHWMREPLAQTLQNIATVDPQGPLNYAIYRAYALVVGSQEQVVRFLPALLSVIGIPVLYALAARLGGYKAGLLAALLWALHPFMIWHAQDARSYALWSVANPLALWLALRALQRGRRIDWILYILAGTLALYIYYLELFTVAALNLFVLSAFVVTRTNRRGSSLVPVWSPALLSRWFIAQVIIAALVAPWYLQDRLLSGGGYGGTTLRFNVDQLFSDFIPTLVFGETFTFGATLVAVLLLVIFAALIWSRGKQAPLLLVLAVVPLMALAVVSTRLDVFAPRYVLSVSVIIIVAAAVFAIRLRLILAAIPVMLFLVGQTQAYFVYIHDYAKSPDWRSLSLYLQPHVDDADYLVQAAADESFTFYCQEYALSPDCDQKLPANPNQSLTEIQSILTMRSEQRGGVWYVAHPQPNWSNSSVALDWLRANMQPVRYADFSGLPAYEFKRWTPTPNEVSAEPLAVYEDTAELVGIQWWREPGDNLLVWLYLQPLEQTDTPLKIFVHLLDDAGVASQDDQFPQDGRIDATQWIVDAPFRDVYLIPLQNVAPGDYRLAIGFYDPATSRRVLLPDGSDSYIFPLTLTLPATP